MNSPEPARTNTRAPLIPDHELIRCIGQGSYGEVWLARTLTGTFRAVKIVSRQRFSDDRPFEREFTGIQKFEPVSRTHPGLVNILHVGRNPETACFYYVMEIADDSHSGQTIDPAQYSPKTLSQILQCGRVPLPELLPLALALSGSLAYLHDRGLIHRDLKPSNIIFVHGAPKLADIGLVTDMGEKATFVGTAGYIPPEGPGTAAADVYALGKVFYESATGKDRNQYPELPTELRSLEDAPELMRLNEIILRACADKVAERLPSAHELHRLLLELHEQCGFDRGQRAGVSPPLRPQKGTRVTILHRLDEAERPLVQQMKERLASIGDKVFVDDTPNLGLRWARELERQMRATALAILVLSEQSLRDETIAYAAELARRACGTNRGFKLIAVLVRFPPSVPPSLQIILQTAQVLRWEGPGDTTAVLDRLASESGNFPFASDLSDR